MVQRVVAIDYYSDLLCIWAYAAQVRLDELRRNFGERISIEHRFVSIFGDTATRIGERWSDRGGFDGYARHVHEVAGPFGHIELNPEIWRRDIPAGSSAPHAFVRGVALALADGAIEAGPAESGATRPAVEELAWRLRLAFFRDLRDVARTEVQLEVAASMGFPAAPILERLADGRAQAALAADHESAAERQVTGSPTFVMNSGRQKLYGNVGYRVIEANVEELLRDSGQGASWC